MKDHDRVYNLTIRQMILKVYILKHGSQEAVGDKFGYTQRSVCKWLQTGTIPVDVVKEISKDMGISKYLLRPDIYEYSDG